jgi:hypothetical protein
MANNIIHTRAGRVALQALLRDVPAMMTGRVQDPSGSVRGVQLRLGMVALSLIKVAFIMKSRGGTDEAGDRWKPLSPRYIAYGRRHPGLKAIRDAARAKGRPGRPLLTDKQDLEWRKIFAKTFYALRRRLGEREAKATAAGHAWNVLKASGARTIFAEYSTTEVEILRDTGVLFNSLSPGVDGPSGAPNQIFNTGPGFVVVGTNRKGAAAHHTGTARLPQRRLWPDPKRWPQSWWRQLTNQLRDGIVRAIQLNLKP